MSVLLDFLRNFRKKDKGKGVFPGLKVGGGERKRIYVLISLGVIFITIVSGVFLFLFSKPKESFVAYSKPEGSLNKTIESKKIVKKVVQEKLKKKEIKMKKETARIEKKKIKTRFRKKLRKRKKKIKGSFYEYYVLGDKYFRQGDLIKSMLYYEEALKLKADPDIVNNLVVIYTRLSKFEKAEKLIENFPNSRVVYSYLVELVEKGLYSKARSVARRYIKYDNSGYISFGLGYVYEKLGELKKAMECYKEAYEKDPLNPYFALNYARLLEVSGNYLKAYVVYRSISTDNENIKKLAESRIRELKIFIK